MHHVSSHLALLIVNSFRYQKPSVVRRLDMVFCFSIIAKDIYADVVVSFYHSDVLDCYWKLYTRIVNFSKLAVYY